MASIRKRSLKDGTEYWAVLYRRDGKQTSTSFEDPDAALDFQKLCGTVGVEAALRSLASAGVSSSAMTVEQWVTHHIEHLTGVDTNTLDKYRAYLKNDIAPSLGLVPVVSLHRDDVSRWVQTLEGQNTRRGTPPAAKTVRNKLMFLAGALNKAVVDKVIVANPAAKVSISRDEDPHEAVFLSKGDFAALYESVTPYWRLLVKFLVVSGCRFNEATALRPKDIDLEAGTVRFRQSWKHGTGGYRLSSTKTDGSHRTVDVPAKVLEELDLTGEYVFTNRTGGPVRIHGFTRRVWQPAVTRSKLNPTPTPHDLRHTCASWMIAANVPLAVVQKHLGHASITTTIGTYAHLDRSSTKAAADAVERMLA